MLESNPMPRDAARPTTAPIPANAPDEDDGPLSEEDEALLRDLGGWLHTRTLLDAEGPGPEIVVAPPLEPLSEAEMRRRVDAVLGRDRQGAAVGKVASLEQAPGRGRRFWLKALTHGAVAASTIAVVQLLASPSDPSPEPNPRIHVELSSDYASVYGSDSASDEPVFTPASTLELALHTNDSWPSGSLELIIRPRRADAPEGSGIVISVPSTELQIDESKIAYAGRTAHEALQLSQTKLAPGRWILTFEVGPPGACEMEDSSRCIVVGSKTIVLREPRGANAP